LPGPITTYAGINFSVKEITSILEEVLGGGAKAKEIGGIETI
jgi:hypothetical protein